MSKFLSSMLLILSISSVSASTLTGTNPMNFSNKDEKWECVAKNGIGSTFYGTGHTRSLAEDYALMGCRMNSLNGIHKTCSIISCSKSNY